MIKMRSGGFFLERRRLAGFFLKLTGLELKHGFEGAAYLIGADILTHPSILLGSDQADDNLRGHVKKRPRRSQKLII